MMSKRGEDLPIPLQNKLYSVRPEMVGFGSEQGLSDLSR